MHVQGSTASPRPGAKEGTQSKADGAKEGKQGTEEQGQDGERGFCSSSSVRISPL